MYQKALPPADAFLPLFGSVKERIQYFQIWNGYSLTHEILSFSKLPRLARSFEEANVAIC
jgi:hypothetical protein